MLPTNPFTLCHTVLIKTAMKTAWKNQSAVLPSTMPIRVMGWPSRLNKPLTPSVYLAKSGGIFLTFLYWFFHLVQDISWGTIGCISSYIDYTRASQVGQTVKNPPATWETWVQSLGWEVPWGSEWLPIPVFLLENSMDRGAWQATVHEVTKSWTQQQPIHTDYTMTHQEEV